MDSLTLTTSIAPIFIVSSERSGSNLLRVLLGNHSRLHAPVAPQLLMNFAPLVPYYGSWLENGADRELLADMQRVAQHEQYGWQINEPPAGVTFPGLLACFDWMYGSDARRNGKARFVCKENKLFDFVPELAKFYPDAQFIYLYRDPRAYTASWLHVPLLSQSEYVISRRWSDEQRKCLTAFVTFRRSFFALPFESLVSQTRDVMQRLLAFLGEPWEEGCAQTDPNAAREAARNPYWKNIDKPVDAEKADKFREQLSIRQIRIIESMAKNEMRLLGYTTQTAADWQPGKWFFLQDKLVHYWRSWKQRRAHRGAIEILRDRSELVDQIRRQRQAHCPAAIGLGERT